MGEVSKEKETVVYPIPSHCYRCPVNKTIVTFEDCRKCKYYKDYGWVNGEPVIICGWGD